jgi:hypothetical protein
MIFRTCCTTARRRGSPVEHTGGSQDQCASTDRGDRGRRLAAKERSQRSILGCRWPAWAATDYHLIEGQSVGKTVLSND